ncbi:hypothetical protein [Isoptericola croceus]|uniref:hypothetical protein n=1 Tax=Isoptericola croceus TaxID=3031406 RepID=UPI0023F66666|nr:hypothetical protein [Isoptericola croceus]
MPTLADLIEVSIERGQFHGGHSRELEPEVIERIWNTHAGPDLDRIEQDLRLHAGQV